MFCALSDLAAFKSAKKPLLGVDLGDKTIGLSLSDRTWMIATPYKTIQRTGNIKKDFAELSDVIKGHAVVALVFGHPINMNGTEGPQSQKVKQFAENFLKTMDIPILFWDERLSTAAVTRTMITADLSRKRQKEVVDKMAASFILQGVLDFLARHP
ncbi:MAG: Holliday junction resolvase RuvX [Alphaproteobacteria bacterium]|nr:Holliday junction resolvase RuvX [Alphaproteobacteria bacterium]